MGEVLAQVFFAVRGEIDHQQPAAGPQRARRLAERARGIVEEMQHLMDDDEIVGVALDRRGVDVALAQLHVAQAALVDARARQRQHRRALVDADGALGERRDELEHAAGAGAQVEQRADRLVADHRQDRGLDPFLRRVQGADGVPIGGALGEIGGGLLAARLARQRKPRAVGGERRRRRGRCARSERGRTRRPGRRGGRTPRPPRAGARRGPASTRQLEMARDARLRLAENGDELAHRQLGLAEQADEPQARHLARRLEARQQRLEAHGRRRAGGRLQIRHKDMFISNLTEAQAIP